MLAFLKAIPAIASLISLLVSLFQKLVDKFKEKPSDIIVENAEVIDKLKEAKTKEERLDAAKKIQDLID